MIEVTSVDNMRKSDSYTIENKIDSLTLMYKAGEGIYNSVKWHGRVLIACGTGNNAGDGYVVALLLKRAGYDVELLLAEERFSPDGLHYYNMCREENVPTSVYNLQKLDGYDIILDCIFGTGFKGEAKGNVKALIEAINESGAYIVSADINSGLNGDSGLGNTAVKSDLTVSIGTYKSGHFLSMAKDKIGSLENVDIGIDLIDKPYLLLEKEDVRAFLGNRLSFSNKGTYGYISLLGGCLQYGGAMKLANLSATAMRSGAGVVRLCVPKDLVSSVAPYILESTLYPLSSENGSIKFYENEIQGAIKGSKAVAIGMGLGQEGDNAKIIEYVLQNADATVIIDADGLNTLSKMDLSTIKNSRCRVVLTPHLKEMERLCGVPLDKILENPVFYATEFAREIGAILLLKGPTTIITDGKTVYLTDKGCAGMATAGSGDVLSGIIAALCASHSDTLMATAAAAYINGYAGEIAQKEFGAISMIASDTAKSVAKAINQIQKI